MKDIKLLDCTLRDGGYCNEWRFGYKNIGKIIRGLEKSKTDIIECGFLTNTVAYEKDVTKFTELKQLEEILSEKQAGTLYVVMVNYGEYEAEHLPECKETVIDGIRLAFHKKDLPEALKEAKKIKEKGYLVFLQPMVSMSYSDEEFINLLKQTNEIEPYAFYIVDSFGMMKEKDLLRFFFLSDINLKENIYLGFHSHNNIQMAYANARAFVQTESKRDLIVDDSIMGMGRGAGNLNAELMMPYLHDNWGKDYDFKPLLKIIDEVLNIFYKRNYWGYSLTNYLSAVRNVHPNYATYLEDKQTLTLEGMEAILTSISEEKAVNYDKNYIEELYMEYLEAENTFSEDGLVGLQKILENRCVLIIASGKSSKEEQEKITTFAQQENTVSISVNFKYPYVQTDYVFVSNRRRFSKMDSEKGDKLIVTSNIEFDNPLIKTSYKELLIDDEIVKDNSALMLIKFLIKLNVKNIVLAGVDGYSYHPETDYIEPEMGIVYENIDIDKKNEAIQKNIRELGKQVSISTLTKPKYIKIKKLAAQKNEE